MLPQYATTLCNTTNRRRCRPVVAAAAQKPQAQAHKLKKRRNAPSARSDQKQPEEDVRRVGLGHASQLFAARLRWLMHALSRACAPTVCVARG
eukprot:6207195-Pleurochrysis_carterae.AAC.15